MENIINFFNKHSKKKTILILSTIFSGIVTFIWLLSKYVFVYDIDAITMNDIMTVLVNSSNAELMAMVTKIMSMIKIVRVIFYSLLVLSIFITILSGIYYFKKNKKESLILGEFIFSSANSVFLLLSMSGINNLYKIVKTVTNGDFSVFQSYDIVSKVGNVISMVDYIKYLVLLSILMFVFNIFIILIMKKIININNMSFDFIENDEMNELNVSHESIQVNDKEDRISIENKISAIDTKKIKELIISVIKVFDIQKFKGLIISRIKVFDKQKIKEFFKTKNGKTVISVIVGILIVFGSCKIYDTYFNFIKIDLCEDIVVEFDGINGRGYIEFAYAKKDYNESNFELKEFMDTVYAEDYIYDYEDLRNGDKITITMCYDKDYAEDHKIKVVNDMKTITVEGLRTVYYYAEDIPNDIISQLEKDSLKEVEEVYASSDFNTYTITFDSLWLGRASDENQLGAVYRIDRVYKSLFNNETKKSSFYVVCSLRNTLDSNYLNNEQFWETQTLYDENYADLNDPKGIEAALDQKWSYAFFEKIK